MATKYGGMPSGIQANLEKKKKAAPVVAPVTRATIGNTISNPAPAPVAAPRAAPVVSSTPVPAPAPVVASTPTPASAPVLPSTAQATTISALTGVLKGGTAPKVTASPVSPLPTISPVSRSTIDNSLANPIPSAGTPTTAPTLPSTDQARIISDMSAILDGGRLQDKAYNDVVSINTDKTQTPLAPSSASGSSGGGSISGGYSSPSGAATYADPGSTVTPTLPGSSSGTSTPTGKGTDMMYEQPILQKEPNKYFDDLVTKKFEYNPATDQGYLQAAAGAENAIIQSIIGRGGLYSSVAQSAVATKLTDLAIEYEKMAYGRYTDDRSYMMQLTNFEQSRIDTAWDQNFKAIQFNTAQEQQAYENYANSEQQRFENEMNLAEFQFAQEKEAFDRNMTLQAAQRSAQASYSSGQASSAKATTESEISSIQSQLATNKLAKTKFTGMKSLWASSGRATKEVAQYFAAYGVQVGDSLSDFADIVNNIGMSLDNEGYSLAQQAVDLGEAKAVSSYLDDYSKSVATPPLSKTSTAPTAVPLTDFQKQRQGPVRSQASYNK